ncbi:MAG TPA: PLP-dependent transferase, partial [Acidimicrobiales bacterium]|nr:PLP-dependent transferase [Acidimicrobiales bacterium]
AIHTVLSALTRAGDTIVSSREIYGGTYSLFERTMPRRGVSVRYVDPHDLAGVASALAGANVFYVETIANPLCSVADLPALAELCAAAGVTTVVDSTFATPYLCTPAELGYDFVVHSATKFIGGHSDLLAGVVCCSSANRDLLRDSALDTGGAMQPFEAWLCVRGLQTMELRMERHCRSAAGLASALSAEPSVVAVHYPGLRSHPQHRVAREQLRKDLYGGILSFEVGGGPADVATVCERLRIAWRGASLGGAHTLVTHPASTTHRQMDAQARRAAGLPDGLVRVSVGLEDITDLMADFRQALRG